MKHLVRDITRDEVGRHNTPTDGWIIINGYVCDVTSIVSGDSLMLPLLGMDGSDALREMNPEVIIKNTAIGKLKSENTKFNPASKISIIDINKPLIRQIYKLNHTEYCQLIKHKVLNSDPCRMFSSDILESFSRTQWFVIPIVWLPVAFYSLYLGFSSVSSTCLFLPFLWFIGSFLWTLFEYIFHRYLFHFDEHFLPNHGAAFVIHFTTHAIHHMFPMDRLRLVMPPVLFVILAGPIFVLSKYILNIPPHMLYALWSGGVTGYVAYDLIHYSSHFCTSYRIPHITTMKTYHMKHHYKTPTLGFGVSSKFWDVVFGTLLD